MAVAGRRWVEDPDVAGESVIEATGRGWDEWCEIVDAWPGHVEGHAAVARHLAEEYGVPGWWAQAVTVGWERISGRRRTHQRSDGTFEVNASKTVAVDAGTLRARLLSDGGRAALFPAYETGLRSRPDAKAIRFTLGPGVALVSLTAKDDGRTQVAVAFTKLPESEDLARWKAYWKTWLAGLADAG